MAKNDERLIFGVGFDIATGIDAVIKEWESKESKRLQKALDKKPLEVSLKIKKNALTELRDFIGMAKTLASAQRELNNVKKQEAQIEATNALAKERNAKARKANIQANIQEASREDQLAKKKADRLYSELKLADAQKNGFQQTNEQSQAYVKQSSYLQRLITRMAAYISIRQVLNWVQQIRAVTAEFELQRISLGALIQDAHKASTIFEQIKVQAVRSPYEVKDLVDYTKRLAAYGVEADELMGTMNRLADISAGLGADMNRIILAYGQIQAAGVLKGTELRQLTELGLPMVELLAQYYSTLRSEVVSTSEVFDMISKKEVPFEAVKDILEDLTEVGGRFYDMQSVQAQTLQGQWTNMKDTLSVMFDEIGRTDSVRNKLEWWMNTVKAIAFNWEEVAKAVKVVALAYGTLKGASIIINLLSITTLKASVAAKQYRAALAATSRVQMRANGLAIVHAKRMELVALSTFKAAKATNVFFKALWKAAAAIMTNPVGWVVGLVGAIAGISAAVKLFGKESKTAFDKFKEGLTEAKKAAASNSEVMVSNFRRLVRMAVENADGSYKQRAALRKLSQQYGDIFPQEQLRIENLRKMGKGGYEVADSIESMSNAIRSFNLSKFESELIEQYTTHIEDQFKETFVKLTDGLGTNYAGLLGEITREADKWGDDAYTIFKKVVDKFLNYSDVKAKQLSRSSGGNVLLSRIIGDERSLKEYFKEFKNLPEDSLSDSEKELKLVYDLAMALSTVDEEIKEITSNFGQMSPAMTKAITLLDEARVEIKGIEPVGKTQEEYDAFYDEEVRKILKSKRDALDEVKQDKVEVDVDYNIAVSYFEEGEKEILGEFQEVWKKWLASSEARRFINGNMKVQIFDTQQIKGLTSLTDALKSTAEAYKENEESLAKLNEQKKAAAKRNDAKEEERLARAIEKTTVAMRLRRRFLELFGGLSFLDDKKDDKKVNPNIKKLENEVALVEKIYKKYKELSDMYGDVKAREMVDEYFKDVKFTWLGKAYSPDELKAQLQKAVGLFKKYGADAKDELQNTRFKIGNIDFDEAKDEMEKKLKELSDDISDSKTAKDFFDKMLGLTGDRDLSASLTLSVYGTYGDDLESLMQKEIEEAFKTVDLSYARLDGGKFDINALENLINDIPLDQRENAQKIVDNWRKVNADILNDVIKSYEDYLTYEERKTRVMEREAEARKKISESLLPDDEKEKYLEASKKREAKEVGDIVIEEFKASDAWIKSFEELDRLATPTIERLIDELKKFMDAQKDSLNAEQLKVLMTEYDKLYEGLVDRNPYKAITDSIKEYKEAVQRVNALQNLFDVAKETGNEELADKLGIDLTNAMDEMRNASSKLQDGLGGVSDDFAQLSQLVQNFTDILGLPEDSGFAKFLDDIAMGFDTVSKTIAFAQLAMQVFDGTIKTILTSNPIGWILLAASAIITTVKAIMNAKVEKINEEIEHLQGTLDNLEYAFTRLETASEKAFSTEYIDNYERRVANLQARYEAYLKQANMERSKGKKADEDKIKEYEEQARDTADVIKDMQSELSEHFLGTDLTSAARDFANAWIDAYKEFGSTADAMKEKFQDMIQNMIVESFAARVIQSALEPIFDSIDDMSKDGVLDVSEASKIADMTEVAIGNIDVGMTNLMNALSQAGYSVRGMGGELTGISRDIATASEESILGLAAGINTQNFYISQVPTKLDTIIGLLRGDGAMPQGSAMTLQDVMIAQNQFLSHLPTIAQHTAETVAECKQIVAETRRTADALDRVIKPDGTRTTYKMNVVTSYQG